MSEFNIERLREAVAWAEFEAKQENPSWLQTVWAKGKKGRKRKPARFEGSPFPDYFGQDDLVEVKCESAYCVAGWVCAGEKDKFVAYDWSDDQFGVLTADYVIPKGTRELKRVSTRARELLGITEKEADELFEGHNTIRDIKRIARKIAKRRGETL